MRKYVAFCCIASILLLSSVFFSDSVLQIVFKDKVWLHKVNSLEKLSEVTGKYPGVELDVVYDSQRQYFDIHHPPEQRSGLSLQEYFESVSSGPEIKIWIDFKNLNETNVNKSLSRLIKLCEVTEINPNTVLVEAKDICLLTSFQNAGFNTSYYLPSGLNGLDPSELDIFITNIQTSLKSCSTTYISSEFKDYKLLNEYFPNQKKLFWFTAYGGMNKLKARLLIFKLLRDEKVEILLMRD